jgi:hypothetical protein
VRKEKKRRTKLSREEKQKVGLWLREKKVRKGERGKLAAYLEVGVRSLWNWERANPSRRPGRPPCSESVKFRLLLAVRREFKEQGWTVGWRPIFDALLTKHTSFLQDFVRDIKARHQARLEARLRRNRVHVDVLMCGAFVVEDGAQIQSSKVEVLKDRGSLKTVEAIVSKNITSKDVISGLEQLKATRGLPLVLGTDNGSIYREKGVKRYLEKEHVIHLLSKVHTPQDNASAERGIGELKAEMNCDEKADFSTPEGVLLGLRKAVKKLSFRKRASKGYKTSIELESQMPCWRGKIARESFYEQASRAIREAVSGKNSAKSQRVAEREAIFSTLEQFQVIKRTKGGVLA